MASATMARAPSDGWESIPGWTPVYVGLGRFRTGLVLRLMVVAVAPPATTLAVMHGPRAFLLATLAVVPLLGALTSAIMVSGLTVYAHPPKEVKASGITRSALRSFTALLVVDVAHLALAVIVIFELSGAATIDWLFGLQLTGWLVGLGCIGVFMASLQKLTEFVGATPALSRLKHLWWGLPAVVVLVLVVHFAGNALLELGTGWHLTVASAALIGGVLLLAGVLQVVSSLRENLFLTTSEFAAVSVTGEHRALPDD